ncbi:MAG: hypothetical protein K5694_05520 [Bacilli bacterium]|nr:hypothetical protein [Bacilli bacterium]
MLANLLYSSEYVTIHRNWIIVILVILLLVFYFLLYRKIRSIYLDKSEKYVKKEKTIIVGVAIAAAVMVLVVAIIIVVKLLTR